MEPPPMPGPDVPVARRTGHFARWGAVVAVCIALVLDITGLLIGLSDDGWGWAGSMPVIAMMGLVAATGSLGALILGILRLMQARARDAVAWGAVVSAVCTGLGGGLLILISAAASASV